MNDTSFENCIKCTVCTTACYATAVATPPLVS